MDFDDLLLNTYKLLNDFPEVMHKYQNKFKYILVDEYQDTNHIQYLIIKILAALNENICVVGDDAQSIYAFRGANIQNILNFKIDYPEYKLYKLEQNYRSTKNIVKTANSLIKHNEKQIEKVVWTDNKDGDSILICETATDNDEGRLVANTINNLLSEDNFSDFAILYRTNAQSRALEESLRKMGIPYKIYGGLSFYQRKEIKDLLSYFRMAINLKDEEALKRTINYPARGIGTTTIQKLIISSNENDISIWEVISGMGITQMHQKSNMIQYRLLYKRLIPCPKRWNIFSLLNWKYNQMMLQKLFLNGPAFRCKRCWKVKKKNCLNLNPCFTIVSSVRIMR